MTTRYYTIKLFKYDENSIKQMQSLESNCNAITFKNKGDAIAYIEGYPLAQDEELAIGGLEGEKDITTYRYSFGTGTVKALWVFRKTYVDRPVDMKD